MTYSIKPQLHAIEVANLRPTWMTVAMHDVAGQTCQMAQDLRNVMDRTSWADT
jgi:hypothetical protein